MPTGNGALDKPRLGDESGLDDELLDDGEDESGLDDKLLDDGDDKSELGDKQLWDEDGDTVSFGDSSVLLSASGKTACCSCCSSSLSN